MLASILVVVLATLLGGSFSASPPTHPPYLHCHKKTPVAELLTSNAELLCPTLNTSRGNCNQDRYTVSPDIVKPTGYPYSEFISFLQMHSKKILLVGDSISRQMHHSFKCTLEAEMISQGLGIRSYLEEPAVFGVMNRYLSELSYPYRLRSNAPNAGMPPSEPYVDNLYRFVLENNYTHLVLNTGAWYLHSQFEVNTTDGWRKLTKLEESVSVFKSVFAQGGPLLTALRVLHHKHRVTILWRDIAPAGSCKEADGYPYHQLFPEFNSIAREAIRSIGGHVLHGVWDHAIHRWQDHLGKGDLLHWCLFRPNSVPSHWNELLIKYVYKQLK